MSNVPIPGTESIRTSSLMTVEGPVSLSVQSGPGEPHVRRLQYPRGRKGTEHREGTLYPTPSHTPKREDGVPDRRVGFTRCRPGKPGSPWALLVSSSPGGAVFRCEFLLGDAEFRHRRLEVVVLEFLRWNTSVLFDLLGLPL